VRLFLVWKSYVLDELATVIPHAQCGKLSVNQVGSTTAIQATECRVIIIKHTWRVHVYLRSGVQHLRLSIEVYAAVHIKFNILSFGGRALNKRFVYWTLSRQTAKHTCANWLCSMCGSRTEAFQKYKYSILNLAA